MLAKFIRPKITCSPSYADYKPKTNTVSNIIGHRAITHWKDRKGEGNKKL
jgi:hypothetical protein